MWKLMQSIPLRCKCHEIRQFNPTYTLLATPSYGLSIVMNKHPSNSFIICFYAFNQLKPGQTVSAALRAHTRKSGWTFIHWLEQYICGSNHTPSKVRLAHFACLNKGHAMNQYWLGFLGAILERNLCGTVNEFSKILPFVDQREIGCWHLRRFKQ